MWNANFTEVIVYVPIISADKRIPSRNERARSLETS